MKNIEFNSQTAVAIGRLIVTILASITATLGWSFDADLWLNIFLSILSVVLLAYSWWKNNNITLAAQEAQSVLSNIKATNYAKAGYDESVKELQAEAVAREAEEE